MRKLMFDYSPREDVPWFDGSLARLYEYFERTPELWVDAAEFMKTRMKLDEKKASDYLRRFLAGDPSIKLPRLSFALQHMYDYDEDFQSAVDRSLTEKDPDDIPDVESMGEYLAEQLSQLVYGQSAAQHAQDVEAAAAQERQRQRESVAAATPVVKEGKAADKDADKDSGKGGNKDAKKMKLPWQK
eukprot:GHRQ01019606.1.p1 GENE.GHRQ01019606.1~~GHRQ01019606.1.p1  ORF type:complete len:186 (+),score=93.98 GHRQ01019606.1:370-927(+)